MNATKRITKTYAKSLFQNILNEKKKKASAFDVDTMVKGTTSENTKTPTPLILGEELLIISTLMTLSKKIITFFKNPTNSEKKKKEFLLKNFPGLTIPMKSFLEILTERGHLYLLPEISQEYSELLSVMKKLTKVKIITASKFPRKTLGKTLLSSLQTLTNSNEIILSFAYNPKLLGGFIIEYGSLAIDASILKEFSLFFNDI